MNIDDVLASLEKSAEQVSAPPTQEAVTPALSTELEGLLQKEASAKIATDAFKAGEALAAKFLEKLAAEQLVTPAATESSATPVEATESTADTGVEKSAGVNDTTPDTTKGPEMTTQEDKALAATVMEKIAAEFNAPATQSPVANQLQSTAAVMTAEHDARITPTPGGTVNQMADALVNKALSMGAAPYDAAAAGGSATASKEGTDPAMGTPGIPADGQEKVAAVIALMEAGANFETAVDLVKEAAAEIANEEFQQVKVAAVNELMTRGYSFDSAVEAVNAAVAQ